MSASSLALQSLLKSASARLNLGAAGAERVTGLSPAAQALFLAAAANRHAQIARHGSAAATLIVVVPTDADVEQYTGDVRFFLSALEGLSDAAARDAVLPFPSHEVDPYRGLRPHLGVMSARTRALHAAATGTARVIVASATGLLPRVSSPDRLLKASLELKPGSECDPYDLAALLVDAGFTREDPVDAHGEFCVRGGVVDVFPAANAQPVRLDFVGDTVESVRHYDPATQRSTGETDRVVIIPLQEVFDGEAEGGGRRAEVPQTADRDSGQWTVDSGQRVAPNRQETAAPPKSTSRQIDKLADAGQDTLAPSPQPLAPEDDLSWAWQDADGDDIEDEGETDAPSTSHLAPTPGTSRPALALGTDQHVAPGTFLSPGADRSSSLFDFVKRPLMFVCEAEDVRARAEKSLEQLAASHADATAGGAVVPPPSDLFLPLDDLDVLLDEATVLEELEIEGQQAADSGQLTADEDSGQWSVDSGQRVTRVTPDTEEAAAKSTNQQIAKSPSGSDSPLPRPSSLAPSPQPLAPSSIQSFVSQPAVEFRGRVADWAEEIKRSRLAGETVLFVAATPGRAERTVEMLRDYELIAVPVFVDAHKRDALQARTEMAHAAALLVATGNLSRGFSLPQAALRIFAETDVFEEERRPSERRRAAAGAFLSDFRDLKVGNFVVHVDHGIGMFVGLRQIPVDQYGGPVQEFLELRYAGDDKLFVPVERLDLLQKYTGASKPPLDRLGGTTWERAKTRVKKAMRDMAEELLRLYAQRRALPGHAFPADTHWQEEFEEAFEFDLTPDQRSAVADIKSDMESASPMDRLLCGDVGYGKTEVAMRAAFKAVMDGKQVAFLAPTTILAFQHQKTLRERFAGFPVRIDMVSRFRSKGEIKQTLTDLAAGKVDVIVGTHRLLSKDVVFHDLGLLVVDEEQRFGVAHKERIKQMRKKVDVLTMTATPIPRTLNMSLVGIRDMSVIETPPKDRLAIQTNVVRFDQQVIAKAIRGELARGGQVYFVHNRVQSIYAIGDLVRRLVPEARIVVGHGQMGEDELECAMVDFMARKYDVLLATTIVENGLDIPNVNTIIINRADRYGLSQLYQLRGRVGRSDRPAYAYLLIPPGNTLSPVARKRLAAIREFSDLGSGFRVAALDLEIRGAGNLLGGEQSGHIEAIGFEMYMKLLEETVRELKGEEVEDETRATVNLGIDLRIEEKYVPDMNQRLMLYRRVAGARSDRELQGVVEEIEDRYGPMPDEVLNLVEYGRIRILADRLGIEKIDRQGSLVVFTFKDGSRGGASHGRVEPNLPSLSGSTEAPASLRETRSHSTDAKSVTAGPDPARVVRLVREHPDVTLVPPSGLKLDLKWKAKVGAGKREAEGGRRAGLHSPPSAFRRPPGGAGAGSAPPSALRRPPRFSNTPSWWTARATEEEVKPGFSKEAIVRPVKEDPRGEEGVLTRVGALLSVLAGKG